MDETLYYNICVCACVRMYVCVYIIYVYVMFVCHREREHRIIVFVLSRNLKLEGKSWT